MTPFLVARREAPLAALAAELGCGHLAADATDPSQRAAAVAAAGSPLAGLAFCVGSIVLKPLAKVTEADMLDAFCDGVFVVTLDTLTDATLVPAAVAQVFGLRESPDVPVTSILIAHLQGKQLLLIMDNLEQVIVQLEVK